MTSGFAAARCLQAAKIPMVLGTPESHLRSEKYSRYFSKCLKRWLIQKWTPNIGQHDKCISGSSCQPGSGGVVDTVRCLPIKCLVSPFCVVKLEVPAQ